MESEEVESSPLLALLPDELLACVVQQLNDGTDVAMFGSSCRRLLAVCDDPTVWKALCMRRSRLKRFRLNATSGNWKNYYSNFLKNVYPVNKLAIVGLNSEISVCNPDGSEKITLAEGESGAWNQPTWCHNGNYLAVSAIRQIAQKKQYHMIRFDSRSGKKVDEVPCRRPGFYTYWHPDDTRLTLLSNWLPGALACTMVDYAQESPPPQIQPSVVQIGRPLYYTFSPFSEYEILAHVNEDELRLIDFKAQKNALIEVDGYKTPGYFAAPVWTLENKIIAVLMKNDDEPQELVMFDLPSLESATMPTPKQIEARKAKRSPMDILMRTLAAFAQGQIARFPDENSDDDEQPVEPIIRVPLGNVTLIERLSPHNARYGHDFVCSPCGNYVAYRYQKSIRVSQISTMPPSVVYTSPESDASYSWLFSPDGQTLLILHDANEGDTPLHWEAYHIPTQRTLKFQPFANCEYMMETYLPFQSQYWQSLTIVSPDSKAFVYPADDRILVQKLEENCPAVDVGPGLFACWSWT